MSVRTEGPGILLTLAMGVVGSLGGCGNGAEPAAPAEPPTRAVEAARTLGPVTLSAPRVVPTGRAPHFVDYGDLDEDGRLDLVVANCHASTVTVYEVKDGGQLRETASIPVAGWPTCVDVADLDGDGHLDVAVSCFEGQAVELLWGRGDGSFETQRFPIGDGTEPHAVVIAQVDDDGHADLAVANGGTDEVVVHFGAPGRSFSDVVRVPVGDQPYSLVVRDLNLDGRLDLVTGNNVSGDVSVVLGRGKRSFGDAVSLPTGREPNIVDVADLDGDGHLDIAVANCKSDSVSILAGDGGGGFTAAADLACDRDVTGVAAVDLDGTAPLDLIVLSGAQKNASLYRGTGSLEYERLGQVSTGEGPCHFLWEDIDGDGLTDLVVPNMGSDDMHVYMGARPEGAPPGGQLIRVGYSSLTPLHCAIGEVLASTDILATHGLHGEFFPFEHGKDQHEACSAGRIDATFTCEVPAMVHLDRLPGLALTGFAGELGEIALVVPVNSPIREAGDLAGRTVAVLGGASSELLLGRWLDEVDLHRDVDVHCPMHGGTGETAVAAVVGGDADAAVLWDPWLSKALEEHGLRVVRSEPFWSLVAAFPEHDAMGASEAYMEALTDALEHIATHTEEVATLVERRSGIPHQTVLAVLRKNRFVGPGQAPDLSVPPEVRQRLSDCEAHARATGRVAPDFDLVPRLQGNAAGVVDDMVLVPGGTYWMGAVARDREARPCERPRHQVTVQSFWMDRHEVTVARYTEAVDAGIVPAARCVTRHDDETELCNMARPDRLDHPVNGVSWEDAEAYCNWRGTRLPSEAEFEYALRAGRDDAIYPWGDGRTPPDRIGNIVGEETVESYRRWDHIPRYTDPHVGTSPVGSFEPNPLGLYDLTGNVWEWCSDWYAERSYAADPQADPQGPSRGEDKILRGGGFHCILAELRSAERHHKKITDDSFYSGFRCARTP